MDRIQRALERAQAERERLQQAAASAAVAADVRSGPEAPDAAARASAEVAPEPELQARRIPVDQAALADSRLLLPGLAGPASHSFKMLRTQVMRRMRQHGWNSLAVMSAAPDEGKTFTAINLAIAIAADRDTTALLVDLDLRAPRIHKRFGFEPAAGVEDCLQGRASLGEALVSFDGYPDLLLLPARRAVEHSSELISSAAAREFFKHIKQRYANRVVIFDLPPVLGSDDALAFAPQVDAALVVVGDHLTRREELSHALELLRDVPVVGTVLNGSRSERSAEYAYGY